MDVSFLEYVATSRRNSRWNATFLLKKEDPAAASSVGKKNTFGAGQMDGVIGSTIRGGGDT